MHERRPGGRDRHSLPTDARGTPARSGSDGTDPPSAAAVEPPALRDAAAILERAHADEVEALALRVRLRSEPPALIEPDDRIAGLLGPDEHVLAVRRSAVLERRHPPPGLPRGSVYPGLAGDLYLTTARLLHAGRLIVAIDLEAIDDAVVAGERLLLSTCDGIGVRLDVDRPRVLRVEISAARTRRLRAARAVERGPEHRGVEIEGATEAPER